MKSKTRLSEFCVTSKYMHLHRCLTRVFWCVVMCVWRLACDIECIFWRVRSLSHAAVVKKPCELWSLQRRTDVSKFRLGGEDCGVEGGESVGQ